MMSLVTLVVLGQFIPGTKLVPDPPAPPPNLLVWRTDDVLGKGVNRTLVAKGTRAGQRYRFHATGVCKWEGTPIYFLGGPPGRMFRRSSSIFGIDFRVQFGATGERQLLNVGSSRPEETNLEFVADTDDAQIRVFDNWDLPKGVVCTIEGLEVLTAP